jgi:serine/threonine-protein kinase
MSRVFVARENALGRSVVIKVLPEEMAGQISMDRFRREIALAAQLQHPHIVPLLAAGEVNGLPYFTMPFVRGESLRARLVKHGEMPVNDAVRVLREVASALASAHDEGVVHRDIKPDNVLLSGDAAMVTDFGVAKALTASTAGGVSSLTSLGVALGTPAYMAPEQASADPHADARVDIYAWGVLGYELLTGATPFGGRPPQMMLAAHVTEAPDSIAKRRPNIPAPLASLIMRCLEKRASDRPQRAQELVQALDSLITPSGGMQSTTAVPATAVSATPAQTRTKARSLSLAVVGIAASIAIMASIFTIVRNRATKNAGVGGADGAGTRSVAVLPFANVGGDTANEYFADGLTEDLAAALMHTGKLRVAARSSSFAFKGKNPVPSDVGKQLNVGTMVEGSVQRAAGRVKVRASLINASDGLTLWSDTYERDSKDVFAVQSELSQAIAAALRVTLTGEQAARVIGTANAAAHDLVLRGRYQNDVFTEASIRQAIQLFNQAIALDSNYAEAWAGVAASWGRLGDDFLPPRAIIPHARQALTRALTLDSTSSAALTQLGTFLLWYDRDYAGAARALERALQIDSAETEGAVTYSELLTVTGHPDSAAIVLRRAIRLDPLSAILARLATNMFLRSGLTDEARRSCDRAIELYQARFANCRVYIANAEGRASTLVDSLRAAVRDSSNARLMLARVEGFAGQSAEARRDVEAVIASARAKGQYLRENEVAGVYALIGDNNQAMQWLDRAWESNASGMLYVPRDRKYRSLSGDPRFRAFVKKLGLP